MHQFLKGNCTHMLFWDSDIEATPDDALSLLTLADPESDKDVVCGLYPKKDLSGTLVFTGTYNPEDPFEVSECGTGFMLIQRRVFEQFAKAYPDLAYTSDQDDKGRIIACFDTFIEDGRYLSEDYNFCRLIRKIGLKVWVAPWLRLNHLGHYKFTPRRL